MTRSSIDDRIWMALGAECDSAPQPNAAEDDYAAGYVSGLAKAQVLVRRILTAAGVHPEFGVAFHGSGISAEDTFSDADGALAHAGGNKSGVFVREVTSWAPVFPESAEKGLTNV